MANLIKISSVLDIQQDSLAYDVWDYEGGEYGLKPGLKTTILQRLALFFKKLNLRQLEFVEGVYLITSVGSYFYSESSDIDTKVVINFDKLYEIKKAYSKFSQDLVLEYFLKKFNKEYREFMSAPAKGSKRELDWFFISSTDFNGFIEKDTPKWDSIYDVLNGTWLKTPEKIATLGDVDVFNYAQKLAEDTLENIDFKLGKLRRYTINYDYFNSYIKRLDRNHKKVSADVMAKRETIVNNIENILKILKLDKIYLGDMRKETFEEEKLVGVFAEAYNSVNFSDANLLRKILEHFGYWYVLVKLAQLSSENKNKEDEEKIDVNEGFVSDIDVLLREL